MRLAALDLQWQLLLEEVGQQHVEAWVPWLVVQEPNLACGRGRILAMIMLHVQRARWFGWLRAEVLTITIFCDQVLRHHLAVQPRL
jgi:hypothetical protein